MCRMLGRETFLLRLVVGEGLGLNWETDSRYSQLI
jgi:hypothetical protein